MAGMCWLAVALESKPLVVICTGPLLCSASPRPYIMQVPVSRPFSCLWRECLTIFLTLAEMRLLFWFASNPGRRHPSLGVRVHSVQLLSSSALKPAQRWLKFCWWGSGNHWGVIWIELRACGVGGTLGSQSSEREREHFRVSRPTNHHPSSLYLKGKEERELGKGKWIYFQLVHTGESETFLQKHYNFTERIKQKLQVCTCLVNTNCWSCVSDCCSLKALPPARTLTFSFPCVVWRSIVLGSLLQKHWCANEQWLWENSLRH